MSNYIVLCLKLWFGYIFEKKELELSLFFCRAINRFVKAMSDINVIMQKLKGYSFPYYFTAVCSLGVFNILYGKKLKISEAAEELCLSENLTLRLIRPLIALKLIEMNNNKISLTATGELFSSQSDNKLLPKVKFHEKEGIVFWQRFQEKLRSAKINQEMFSNRFVEFSENEEMSNTFVKMMDSVSSNVDISKIVMNRVSREAKFFVDIGGGIGTLTLNILNRIPWLSGKVYDLPHVKEAATLKIQDNNIEKRCEFISGDFFKSVPKGDFFILSRVLHDWNDKDCYIILRNVALQMTNQQKLFVVEKVLPDEVEGKLEDYLADLNVYCMCGGQERTIREFNKMFFDNGLCIAQVFDLEKSSILKCIEVVKL